MRILFWMVLGAALTIGVAYFHDSGTASTATTGSSTTISQRNMVNWDVVSHNWSHMRQRMQDTWTSLSHKMAG
jgi:hypothetical protein